MSKERMSKHPLYNRYHMMKRDAEVCKEWENFSVFAKWGEEHGVRTDSIIKRNDLSKPFGPDNVQVLKKKKTGKSGPYYSRYKSMLKHGIEGWESYQEFESWCYRLGVNPKDQIRRIDPSKPLSPDNVIITRHDVTHGPFYRRYYQMSWSAGVSKEWDHIQNFIFWCKQNNVKPGTQIRRMDLTKPFGPANVYIVGDGTHTLKNDDPLYHRYMNIRNRYGVDKKWDSFSQYSAWCKKNHISGTDRMMRLDRKKPFGPDNVWISSKGIKNHPMYHRYRAMLYYGGVAEEWSDFSKFAAWCDQNGIEKDTMIKRIDFKKPFGPKNIKTDKTPEFGPKNIKIVPKDKKSGISKRYDPNYKRYHVMRCRGGVTEEWKEFSSFADWCKKEGFCSERDQLFRIDTSKPFGPENVKIKPKYKYPHLA